MRALAEVLVDDQRVGWKAKDRQLVTDGLKQRGPPLRGSGRIRREEP